MKPIATPLFAVSLAILLGPVAGRAETKPAPAPVEKPQPRPVSAPGTPGLPQKSSNPWREVIHHVRRSVFCIVTENDLTGKKSVGSGFIIKPNWPKELGEPDHCYLLTSLHVIQDARSAKILNSDSLSYNVDVVLDADRLNDLVVLRMPRVPDPEVGLQIADADSETLAEGDEVAVYGYPTYPDFLDGAFSTGIVAAFPRKREKISGEEMTRFLQVTAPIAQGSSGSPVLNRLGEVVGLISGLYRTEGSGGLGIAAPAKPILNLISRLDEKKGGYNVVPLRFLRKNFSAEDMAAVAKEEFKSFWKAYVDDEKGLKEQYAKALADKIPRSALVQFQLGRAYQDVKDQVNAISAYRNATKLDEDYGEAWHYLAQLLLSEYQKQIEEKKIKDPSMLEEAIRAGERAVKNLDIVETRYILGSSYFMADRYREAWQQLEVAFNENQGDAKVWYMYFNALIKGGETARAKQVLAVGQSKQLEQRLDSPLKPAFEKTVKTLNAGR